MTTEDPRRAFAGRCQTCGRRTVRGALENGTLIEVTVADLTAADELRAWAAGVVTVTAKWNTAIELTTRTDHDRRLRPAGYTTARVWAEHHCTEPGAAS